MPNANIAWQCLHLLNPKCRSLDLSFTKPNIGMAWYGTYLKYDTDNLKHLKTVIYLSILAKLSRMFRFYWTSERIGSIYLLLSWFFQNWGTTMGCGALFWLQQVLGRKQECDGAIMSMLHLYQTFEIWRYRNLFLALGWTMLNDSIFPQYFTASCGLSFQTWCCPYFKRRYQTLLETTCVATTVFQKMQLDNTVYLLMITLA